MNPEGSDLVHWRLPRGCGKANTELAHITRPARKQRAPDVVFVIGTDEIQRGDFSRLREEFSLETPPERLCELIGGITFAIAGYEDCSEELFEIQAVRAYFRQVNLHWPFWLAFCDLRSNSLKILASCVIRNLNALRRTDCRCSDVHIRKGDLSQFFLNAVPLAAAFHHLAGFSTGQGRKRLAAVAKHLGLT